MATVLIIIAPTNFRDEEFSEPYALLQQAGHKVIVASTTTKECTGMLGIKVKPDRHVDQCTLEGVTCLIIPGGGGSPALRDNEKVLTLIREAAQKKLLLCSICWGPTVLSKAGVLKGKKVTYSRAAYSDKIMKEESGALLVDEDVVQDGRLITGKGPQCAQAFGKKIVENLR